MFGTVLTVAYSALVFFVLWRAASVPLLSRLPRKAFVGAGVALLSIFLLGRFVGHDGTGPVATAGLDVSRLDRAIRRGARHGLRGRVSQVGAIAARS